MTNITELKTKDGQSTDTRKYYVIHMVVADEDLQATIDGIKTAVGYGPQYWPTYS